MKKVSSTDVARLAGVSQSTVSFVLNGKKDMSISKETRERVLEAAQQLNYIHRPTHRSHKPKDLVFGIMVPNLSNLYYANFAQSVELYAREQNIRTIICNTTRSPEMEELYVKYLIKHGVDGIIYAFTPNIDKELSIPVVVVGESVNTPYSLISLDSYQSGQMIAEHLYQLGHRKICVISSPTHPKSISSSRQARLKGILDKFDEYGSRDKVIVCVDPEEHEDIEWTYETMIGQQYADEMMGKHPDITAFVGINDMIAHGILSTLQRRGLRVPEDVAVCGFDNSSLAIISSPQLTSIDHYVVHRGCMAVNFLKDFNLGREKSLDPVVMNYRPKLIVRGSTCLDPPGK